MEVSSFIFFIALSSTLFFPHVPFPLFEMSQAVNSEERYWTVEFVAIMGHEVDADVPVKIAERCWGMKGLHVTDLDQ